VSAAARFKLASECHLDPNPALEQAAECLEEVVTWRLEARDRALRLEEVEVCMREYKSTRTQQLIGILIKAGAVESRWN
jgi:hypothetical protein